MRLLYIILLLISIAMVFIIPPGGFILTLFFGWLAFKAEESADERKALKRERKQERKQNREKKIKCESCGKKVRISTVVNGICEWCKDKSEYVSPEQTVEKVRCSHCRKLILPLTAEKNNGACMPCKKEFQI